MQGPSNRIIYFFISGIYHSKFQSNVTVNIQWCSTSLYFFISGICHLFISGICHFIIPVQCDCQYSVFHLLLFKTNKQPFNYQTSLYTAPQLMFDAKPVLCHWFLSCLTENQISRLLFLLQLPTIPQNDRLGKRYLSCLPNCFLNPLENCLKCI